MLGDVEEEKAKATSLEWRERREDDRKVREMVGEGSRDVQPNRREKSTLLARSNYQS